MLFRVFEETQQKHSLSSTRWRPEKEADRIYDDDLAGGWKRRK